MLLYEFLKLNRDDKDKVIITQDHEDGMIYKYTMNEFSTREFLLAYQLRRIVTGFDIRNGILYLTVKKKVEEGGNFYVR